MELKGISNYEMIRNMSIEELAVTILCPNETGQAEIECDKSDSVNCCQCCLDWLKRNCDDDSDMKIYDMGVQ